MGNERTDPGSPGSIRGARRQAVDLSAVDLVEKETEGRNGTRIPLLIRPAIDGVDLAEWGSQHRSEVEKDLFAHGAILFRGFDVTTPMAFEAVAKSIVPDLFGEYGDLPKEGEGDYVYHSTPYPPDKMILFHSESSHLPKWPMKQFFYCVTAAMEGGETPIVDCRRVLERMDRDVLSTFEGKGLTYVRTFQAGVDVSWQDFFKTEDRSDVEALCRREGMDFEWKAGDVLQIRQSSPALRTHPATGERVFFNQILLHHPAMLDVETRSSIQSLFSEDELPRNVLWGDGTTIPDQVARHVFDVCSELAVGFPWEDRDILMIDNMLVSHGRNPFVGPRKIVVAMGQMLSIGDAG
jgi:alpha-ketoglutarate-dependent taurine dioxygenase